LALNAEPAAGRRSRLHGYGPLAGLVVAFVLMVVLVPSQAPTEATAQAGQPGAPTTPAGTVPLDKPVTGSATVCADRHEQVPNDPYSPVCFTFTGDNGGATSKGVTATDIVVSYRKTTDLDLLGYVEQLAHLQPGTPDDIERTTQGLVDYFNKNFQFYGRKIELVPFDGKGSVLSELFGGGQDAATADAVTSATDNGAFADITGVTQPYNDALAKRKVIAFGAPYLSQQYLDERQPYSWSAAPTCTDVAKAAIELGVKQIFGRKALWAGGDLQGKDRKVAIVAPDNPEYQRCVADGLKSIPSGSETPVLMNYTLDLASMQAQAASIVAQLKSGGFTSVVCGCDPLLPVYLTGRAAQQDFTPEWLIMGTALTDTDMAAQLYNQQEWAHAFGASALGSPRAFHDGAGYKAYKTVRTDEPSSEVEQIYQQLYEMAIGLQMAGPDLNPTTFDQGMRAYPPHTGDYGTWSFAPGKYTPQSDVRIVWWDPNTTSTADGQKGTYVSDGQRYALGAVPTGDPKVFTR
jgi:hypothetical protein